MKSPKKSNKKFIKLFMVVGFGLLIMFFLTVKLIYKLNPLFFQNVSMIVILFSSFLFVAVLCLAGCYNEYSKKVWEMLVYDISKAMKAVENGDYNYRMKTHLEEEAVSLVVSFNAMAQKLYQNEREIKKNNDKIHNQNNEIIDANKELYESYKKLTDTYNLLNCSEQKYNSLVNNLTDIVCVIKFDGTIYYANDALKRILGYSSSEVEGRKIYEFGTRKINLIFLEKVVKKVNKRKFVSLKIRLEKKNKKIVHTDVVLTKFSLNGEDIGIQAIVRDVTKANELEKQLVTTNKELSIVNDISRQLNLSLDVKNILSVVVSQLSDVLKVPVCYFSLLDAKTKLFEPVVYAGSMMNKDYVEKYGLLKHSATDKLVLKMFEENEAYIVSDFSNDNLINNLNLENKHKIKEVILVPVKVKKNAIGILHVFTFSKTLDNQVKLLSSIANNLAIAIENAMLYENTQKNFIKTVDSLVAAIEAKDKYTEGHSFRVSKYATLIASHLKLDKNEVEQIKIAGILHDVGKIGIPDSILNKPSKLTESEFKEIQKHPIISNKIIENVDFSKDTVDFIVMHHERWDGKGYPYGKKESEIPLGAQIIAVADALDAMTSKRAYRNPLSLDVALNEIKKGSNSQFNPQVVDALVGVLDSKQINLS